MAVGDGAIFGYDSTLSLAEESTYGTKVTTSMKFIEFNSESFKHNRESKKLETINGKRDFQKRILLNSTVEGSLDANYNPAEDACVILAKHALGGTVTSALPTTTLASDYEHTMVTGNNEDDAKVALTFQVEKGGQTNGGKVWDVTGCRINTYTIKAEINSPVMFTAEVVGKTMSVSSSAPVAVFSDIRPCDFTGITFEVGDSLGNLSTEKIQSFELTINNNLTSDNRELGSQYLSKPHPLRREVSLKVTQRIDTSTAYDRFVANTMSAIQITIDSAQTMTAASTGSFTYRTIIQLPQTYINGPAMPEVGDPGILSNELEIDCLSLNTTTAYSVRMITRNLTSSYT